MKIGISNLKMGLIVLLSAFTNLAFGDNVVVNNNNGQPQYSQQCGGGNQNNVYDPRVPPAGTYQVQKGNGSSDTIYTTGEKKPYYVDTNCNSSNNVQPYVYVQPGFRRH